MVDGLVTTGIVVVTQTDRGFRLTTSDKTIFVSDPQGGLRWRRPLLATMCHGWIVLVVPGVLWVLAGNYGDNPAVLIGCFVAACFLVLHVWSWRLELTADGVILIRSWWRVSWAIDRSDVHAVMSNPPIRNGKRIVLLVGARRKVLPLSSLLPAHYLDDMAEDFAAWAGCERVPAEDFARLRQARKGYPERGYSRMTTRDGRSGGLGL